MNRNPDTYRYLLVKRIKTQDGTVLSSNQAHRPVFHLDENGQQYTIDFSPYDSRIQSDGNHIDLSIYSDSPFSEIRDSFTWGIYGKSGDEPLRFIKLRDMTTDYIIAMIDGNFAGMNRWIFEEELEWRQK